MAQSANVTIDIGSKADTRGFKQAETALDKLSRSVKNVAGALGLAYGTRAIYNFGKASVKAFAADDKAAKVLTRSLNNLGLAFADLQVKDFISQLEAAYGVLDDQLRPAFQRLLTTTANVAMSQDLLKQALDLSAASGIDVVTVAGDLAKAYTGQTRGLTKYGLGLSQTQLKAMKFEDIQKRINYIVGGQGLTAANSYAGSLDKIAIAANNAKEIIGKGLVQALGEAGGTGGLAGSLAGIIKLATTVSDLFVGIGRTIAAISGAGFSTPGVSPLQAIKNFNRITAEFKRQDAEAARKQSMASLNYGGLTGYQKQYAESLAKKKQAEALKLAKLQLNVVKQQTAIQKANSLFDLNQIELIAALKGKLSDEDRKRAELQLAILQENEGSASKLAGQVAKAQGLTADLVAYYSGLPDAKNPFSGWITSLENANKLAAELAKIQAPALAPATTQPSGMFDIPSLSDYLPANPNDKTVGGRYGNFPAAAIPSGQTTVNVTVQGSVVSQGELVDAVRNGLLNSSLDGSGSTVNRLQGSFATL
jgi:hypothetical protein